MSTTVPPNTDTGFPVLLLIGQVEYVGPFWNWEEIAAFDREHGLVIRSMIRQLRLPQLYVAEENRDDYGC
jgi:hypothetical protein